MRWKLCNAYGVLKVAGVAQNFSERAPILRQLFNENEYQQGIDEVEEIANAPPGLAV